MRPEVRPRDVRDRMIVALDLPSVAAARRMVGGLADAASFYKVGMQLVFAGGLPLIAELRAADKRVFLDMKLLDIGNTVAHAVTSIAGLGVTFTTVHAYPQAMRAAVSGSPAGRPGLLGVTVLTSMDDADLRAAGYAGSAADLVLSRAKDAAAAGLDGIVCSPEEASAARAVVGQEFVIVAPGVRPGGSPAGDQKRLATPAAAIGAGADYIVVGRAVTEAKNPAKTAARIVAEIEAALAGRA